MNPVSTAASAFPTFLRSFDLPEPGELRHVARVYVWARWFVWFLAALAWLYPPDAADAGYAPNLALAALLFATNGYLHYRLATERTVSWRWMLALSALDLALLSGGVVAHRLARLVQLGIRQSRYFGRAKTKFQLYLAATVANLTLVAAKTGLPANTGGGSSVGSALRAGTIRSALGRTQVFGAGR